MQNQNAIASLLREAPALIASGQYHLLESKIKAIPKGMVLQMPWLLYYRGACRAQHSLAEARGHFEKAFEQFCSDGDTTGIILSWCGVVDTIANEWGNLKPIDGWVKWFDENIRDSIPSPFPVPEIEARLVSAMVGAMTFRLPSHPDSEMWLKRAYAVIEGEGDINLRIMLGANMTTYYCVFRGIAYRAIPLIDYLKKLSLLPGVSHLSRLVCLAVEAAFHWLIKADPDACINVVSEGLKLSDRSGIHYFDHFLFAQGAHGALTAGNVTLAAEYLDRVNAVLGGISRMDASNYHYLSTWLALLNGDMQGALQHSKNCLILSEEVGVPMPVAFGHIGMAQSLFETGQYEQAMGHIDEAIGIANENKIEGTAGIGLLFKSYFMLEKGETAEGLELLAAGLALWKKAGCLNLPYWRPSVMSGLCIKALNAGIEVDYAKYIIRRRGLVPETPPYYCENYPWLIRINAFGKLKVFREGRPLKLTGKAQGKPVEMLKAILALGGRGVKVEAVMDMLWPDSDADNAQTTFDTTLHRLRKFMGGNDAVILKDGKVGLNELICYLDVWASERLIEKAEDLLRSEKPKGCESEIGCIFEKALSLQKWPFLDRGERTQAMDRLQNRLFRLAGWVAALYEKSGRFIEAAELYRRALEVDGVNEEFYRRLMACYKRLGRNSEVIATYRRCRESLLSAYGVEPAPDTEAIYRSVLKKN